MYEEAPCLPRCSSFEGVGQDVGHSPEMSKDQWPLAVLESLPDYSLCPLTRWASGALADDHSDSIRGAHDMKDVSRGTPGLSLKLPIVKAAHVFLRFLLHACSKCADDPHD